MNIEESLKILGLTEEYSYNELSSVFRHLVKLYHPDKNQDRPNWANNQMLRLNDAYDSANNFLSLDRKIQGEYENPQKRAIRVQHCLQYLIEAIEIYYQYGLDNINLRGEGSRRNHYHSALRRIKKGYSFLKPLSNIPLSGRELGLVEALVEFITSFYKSVNLKNYRPASCELYEKKAFSHYLRGNKLTDMVIKELMFPESIESYKKGRLNENIHLAEAELNAVLIDFPYALCKKEAFIRKRTLHSLMVLYDFHDQGIISLH